MTKPININDLSNKNKILLGLAVASVGIGTSYAIYRHPEQLFAPMWVALLACACFVLCGAAIVSHAATSHNVYRCLIVALFIAMTTIPAWIALGPGSRQCITSVPFFSGEEVCRAIFGVGTSIMLPLLGVAIVQAISKNSV
jgi:hypothetical protein